MGKFSLNLIVEKWKDERKLKIFNLFSMEIFVIKLDFYDFF